MAWYGARNLYLFGVNQKGLNVFEERIVCIEATTFEEAHEKGLEESLVYARKNGFQSHDEQLVYQQDGESLIDGYEVWSELYESSEPLDDFYETHYLKNCYKPINA